MSHLEAYWPVTLYPVPAGDACAASTTGADNSRATERYLLADLNRLRGMLHLHMAIFLVRNRRCIERNLQSRFLRLSEAKAMTTYRKIGSLSAVKNQFLSD